MSSRHEQIKQQAEQWLEYAVQEKLVHPKQTIKTNRSQVHSGVSIDYLRAFSNSIRHHPLLSSRTKTVARELIYTACRARRCCMIDLIPQHHVDYPSFIVSHAWNADFLELVQTLGEDFDRRCAVRSCSNVHGSMMHARSPLTISHAADAWKYYGRCT